MKKKPKRTKCYAWVGEKFVFIKMTKQKVNRDLQIAICKRVSRQLGISVPRAAHTKFEFYVTIERIK